MGQPHAMKLIFENDDIEVWHDFLQDVYSVKKKPKVTWTNVTHAVYKDGEAIYFHSWDNDRVRLAQLDCGGEFKIVCRGEYIEVHKKKYD